MGKVKSAIFLTFYTLFLAALCLVCFVSFSFGDGGISRFNSILSMTDKDADLGGYYGTKTDKYELGGGYVAVYYPEGVLSAKTYEDNLAGYTDNFETIKANWQAASGVKKASLKIDMEAAEKVLNDYKADYVKYGSALYLNKEDVCGGFAEPTEAFKEAFKKAYDAVATRYRDLKADGIRVDVVDDYSIRVFLPQNFDERVGLTNKQMVLSSLAYTGEVTVRCGSSDQSQSAETIMPARTNEEITDYVKSAGTGTNGGNYYVTVSFTKKGKDVLKAKTEGASSDSKKYIFVMVGDNAIITLPIEAQTNSLSVTSTAYTSQTTAAVASLINTSLKGTENDLKLSVGSAYRLGATYGNNALMFLYIAFGVFTLLTLVFFFVRYRILGFVQLYTYLLFVLATVLCVWSIPFLSLSVEVFLAFMFVSAVLAFSNMLFYENARRRFAEGKSFDTSVKASYNPSKARGNTFWQVFDLHIVLAAIGFIGFGIALTSLSSFFFTVGLLSVFSALASLAINRFTFASMIAFTKKKAALCGFKREEVEDDD